MVPCFSQAKHLMQQTLFELHRYLYCKDDVCERDIFVHKIHNNITEVCAAMRVWEASMAQWTSNIIQLHHVTQWGSAASIWNTFTLNFQATIVYDDVIIWKHFPRYRPLVREIHRSPVNSPHKSQWRGALIFSLSCAWINDCVTNREAGDLRRHRA